MGAGGRTGRRGPGLNAPQEALRSSEDGSGGPQGHDPELRGR